MALFDVSKYQLPDKENIDLEATKDNFRAFMHAYQTSREKVGQPRAPKVTQSYSLVPPSTANQGSSSIENMFIQREDDLQEFEELHGLFLKGFAAISHPFKPEITERRRSIFYNRYINGLSINQTIERVYVSKNVIVEESNESILQFCHALELDISKKELFQD